MTSPARSPEMRHVAVLERTVKAVRKQNGELRRDHAQELARNAALTADLHSRELTIVGLDQTVCALRAENQRLAAELATARAVPAKAGVL